MSTGPARGAMEVLEGVGHDLAPLETKSAVRKVFEGFSFRARCEVGHAIQAKELLHLAFGNDAKVFTRLFDFGYQLEIGIGTGVTGEERFKAFYAITSLKPGGREIDEESVDWFRRQKEFWVEMQRITA